MAALTPHTLVAQAMTMVSALDSSFSTRLPSFHMKNTTVGVTTHATTSPGPPSATMRWNRISAPNNTSPVLMNISERAPSSTQAGVPTVLATASPKRSDHRA